MDTGLDTKLGKRNRKRKVDYNGAVGGTTATDGKGKSIAYHTMLKGVTVTYTPLHTEDMEAETCRGWLIVWGTPPCQRTRTRRGVGYIMHVDFLITLPPVIIALPVALTIRGSSQPARRQHRGSSCCDNLGESLMTIDVAMNMMAVITEMFMMEVIRLGPHEEQPARPRNMVNEWCNRQCGKKLTLRKEKKNHAAMKAP